MQWVRRLYAIMDIVQRGVEILGALLALAVLLVVGNTIRLAIQNRRKEIVAALFFIPASGMACLAASLPGFW